MADIEAVVDERGANIVMHHAEAALGVVHKSGSGSLGPFPTSWSANAFFTDGRVDLIPPNVIRLERFNMHYDVHFTLTINLNNVLPPITIYFPCITIKIFKKTIKICPPPLHINLPTVTVPVGHADVIEVTSDFTIQTHLDVSNFWHIEAVIVGVPFLQLGVGTAAIMTALGLAVSAVLAPLPFIGPLLAGAVALITATIGIAGITGFLGPILSPFVTGLTFPIDIQPRIFTVLQASSALNPAVRISLDELAASVVGSDEDELLIQAYISPVI
jgi:hypothetical protein